jgi:hypothetical protein
MTIKLAESKIFIGISVGYRPVHSNILDSCLNMNWKRYSKLCHYRIVKKTVEDQHPKQ